MANTEPGRFDPGKVLITKERIEYENIQKK